MQPDHVSFHMIHRNLPHCKNKDRSEHQKHLFQQQETSRGKWNFVNEARNSKKIETRITSMRNSFGDSLSQTFSITNFRNSVIT